MIRTSHLNAALALTAKLDGMGYRVLPMVNTPLSSLNADLCVPANISADWAPDAAQYVTAGNATTPGQDCSVYTDNMDQTARGIAAYVQSHLSFAKNVVKPVITELVECFTDKVNAINTSATNDFKLIKQDLPAPMLVADIKDAIDDYNGIELGSTVYPSFDAPGKNVAEIVELMKTGNKAADTAIDAWVATVGDGEFQMAYACTFGAIARSSPVISTSPASWNSTLAVFLMARNLHNKPWENCNMSLVDYNVAMGNLRDWTGNILSAIYKSYGDGIRTGLLVTSSFNNTITVNAPIYDEWIANGGNDLMLFATAVRGKRLNFVNEINEAKVELMRAWDMHSAMSAASARNRKYTVMKKTLYDCVFQVIEGNAASVFGHLNNQPGITDHVELKEYKAFKTMFDEYYTDIKESDFTDIWSMAKHIVCDQLFYYTDAGDILGGIEDACKNNPELTVDEAALLSTIKYVSKYVSSQMVLSKI